MIHEAERKAQESAAARPGRAGAKPAAAGATTGAGEIRIIGGQWRRTRLAVAQNRACALRQTVCAKPCSTGWARI